MNSTRAFLATSGILAVGLLLPACRADRSGDDHKYGYSPTGGPIYTDEGFRDGNKTYVYYDRPDAARGYTPTGSPIYYDDRPYVDDGRNYNADRRYYDNRRYRDDYYR